jgi:hypothetical protein
MMSRYVGSNLSVPLEFQTSHLLSLLHPIHKLLRGHSFLLPKRDKETRFGGKPRLTSCSFPVASNPWAAAFPEVLNINDFNGTANGDFVAIKVGDVNNSALIDVQPRSNEIFLLELDEKWLESGVVHEVAVYANLDNLAGLQGGIQVVEGSILDFSQGIIGKNEMTKILGDDKLLGISYVANSEKGGKQLLFTINIQIEKSAWLSDVISLSDEKIDLEAYDLNGDLLKLGMTFNSAETKFLDFVVDQNIPNPFKDETLIRFKIPQSTFVNFRITDLNGRTILFSNINLQAGWNKIKVDQSDLPGSGVYFYSIEFENQIQWKRMIVTE